MGLFGGFKAKFTKDSAVKNVKKTSKKNEVVCVGYRVYSEFQDPPQYLPESKPDVKKQPSAIKTVLPRPESSRNGDETILAGASTSIPTETLIITNPTVKKSSKKKAPDASNEMRLKSSVDDESSSVKQLAELSSIELRNDKSKYVSRSAPNSTYVEGKTSSFNPALNARTTSITNGQLDREDQKPPRSILKSKSSDIVFSENTDNYILNSIKNNTSDSEEETPDNGIITMSSKKVSASNNFRTETVGITGTKSVSPRYISHLSTYIEATVEVGNSNNTVAQAKSSNSYSSEGHIYSHTTRSIGTTSDYAANIFFGGDEEPEIQRPRRINLGADEGEEQTRSSAEC